MHLSKEDIANTEHKRRLNIINSVSGIKPANLIGTISKEGKSNVAIISSVVHLGTNPPLLGFIMRPTADVPRHTFDNISENEFYTINHVSESFIEKAHYTSAKFELEESEFEKCNLVEEYLVGFKAPFVGESLLKMGMKLVDKIPIRQNNTIMIIGEIQHLFIEDRAVDEKGYIDLEVISGVGISGLNRYYTLKKNQEFSYARPNEIPDFR